MQKDGQQLRKFHENEISAAMTEWDTFCSLLFYYLDSTSAMKLTDKFVGFHVLPSQRITNYEITTACEKSGETTKSSI